MAEVKISQLPTATSPVSATDYVAGLQAGVTVKMTLAQLQAAGAMQLANITALRALTGTPKSTLVILVNSWYAGDGGGVFRYDSTDTTSADNGGTIVVDASGKRWKRELDGPYNVRWFNAVGDGSTNDTTAVQAALAALLAAGGGELYFPKGIYCLYSQLSITIDNPTRLNYTAISIKGDGPSISVIEWRAASGGILYRDNTTVGVQAPFYVHDIGLVTSIGLGGTAIDAKWAANTVVDTLHIHNVQITCSYFRARESGGGGSFGYWTNGIVLENAVGTRITNSKILLQIGTTFAEASWPQDGISIKGFSVQTQINNCTITNVSLGIRVSDDTEGVYIDNTDIVNCRYGVLFDQLGEPGHYMSNMHISCANIGIWAINIMLSCILNCSFYANRSLETSGWGNWIGILLEGSASKTTRISDCIFTTENTSHGAQIVTGIALNGGFGYIIDSNHFYGGAAGDPLDIGVSIAATIDHIDIAENNQFIYCTTHVSGTGDTFVLRQPRVQSGKTIAGAGASGTLVVNTFPKAFMAGTVPIVLATHTGVGTPRGVRTINITNTQFEADNTGADAVDINWAAFGIFGEN